MDRPTLTQLLDAAGEIARVAGKAILQVATADGDLGIIAKTDGSPLTLADTASNRVILDSLARVEPQFPILSEEGDLDNLDECNWQTYWCVDPLDGTKEFISGSGEYTVKIALLRDTMSIIWVICIPPADVTYMAAEGLGAWKRRGDGEPVRISARRCVKPTSAVVSRSHLDPDTEAFLARMNITDVVRHGSSLKMCAVAEGIADIYPRFGPTCLWDTAAGTAIAVEAGCAVTDPAGRPLAYDPAAGLRHPAFLVYPKGMELNPL